MGVNEAKTAILENSTALGIEFGSTRIKAVLVDDKNQPIASGAYEWENQYVDGIWTYSLEEIWKGLQGSYQDMAEDVQKKYGVELTSVGAFGVSAMMHGYMPFNKEGELMVPFRTWRNNITGEASEKLAELFHYNIPQRWSIAHLYQAILNGEEHVKAIDYITTLEAYVHWKLTGKRVLGIGDAAGMFPIDSETKDYNEEMVQKFDELVASGIFCLDVPVLPRPGQRSVYFYYLSKVPYKERPNPPSRRSIAACIFISKLAAFRSSSAFSGTSSAWFHAPDRSPHIARMFLDTNSHLYVAHHTPDLPAICHRRSARSRGRY